MTNKELISSLSDSHITPVQRDGLIIEFLKNDDMYIKLNEKVQRAVVQGINDELSRFDHNILLSDLQIKDHKAWYLNDEVPDLLKDMLNGQEEMKAYLNKRANEKETRGPLDHANRPKHQSHER